MTPFWEGIVALGVIAAIVNIGIAFAKRKLPMVALVRALAGLISLAAAAGIVTAKAVRLAHPYLEWQYVFIGVGVFLFAVFFLPSYVERNTAGEKEGATIQQRAARPANATIRLRDANANTDEWVN